MKWLVFLHCVLSSIFAFGQNKIHEKISVSFEYAHHQYAMDSLNKHFLDFYINELGFLDEEINSGRSYAFGLYFRPKQVLDFGFKVGYQHASTQKTIQTEFNGITPQPIETDMLNFFKVSSFNLSGNSSFYVSNYFNENSFSKFFHRFSYALEGSIGLGFNQTMAYVHYSNPAIPNNISYNFAETSNHSLFGQLGVKLEFKYSIKPFSSIGVRFGHQFFNTGILKLKSGEDVYMWYGAPTSINFSGFYYGIYLKLGK